MLLNYFKLAIRLMFRSPFFTLINVVGLSLGFTVFFILWPFTQSGFNSDKFIPDHERISRLCFNWRWTDDGGENWGRINLAALPAYIGPEIARDDERIQSITRFVAQPFFTETTTGLSSELLFTVGEGTEERLHKEERVIMADRNIFDFFGIPLISGVARSALKSTGSVALSETTAARYFGNNDALGRLVRINGNPFQVTGIFSDIPDNSHLRFDIVLSNASRLADWNMNSLQAPWVYTYFKTSTADAQLERWLQDQSEKYVAPILKDSPHIQADFIVQPLDQIVFHHFVNDLFETKSPFILMLLASVSLVVLLMAWMNYINLTIARTRGRYKEIAARKISGAKMSDLFIQFACQSLCMNGLAVLSGLTIIQLVRPFFFHFFHIRIAEFARLDAATIIFFAAIFIIGTLVTSLYPAFLAVRRTARELISKSVSVKRRWMPSVLTTFQYGAAIVLMVWIFIVYVQLDFIMERETGIDKNNVIVIDAPLVGKSSAFIEDLNRFVATIKDLAYVDRATLSYAVPGDAGTINCHLKRIGSDVYYGTDSHGVTDENFIPLHGLKIIAGRNFTKDEHLNAIIITDFSAKRLGYGSPEQAVGQHIYVDHFAGWIDVEIIGVIEDYRFAPYYASPSNSESSTGRGACLTYLNQVHSHLEPQRISVRLTGSERQQAISGIEAAYRASFPGNMFRWYPLEDHILKPYDPQKVLRNQILFFTALAIGVACLGLLGMISNKVVEKTKEIGIRKILGAKQAHVAAVLLKTSLSQVLFATFISVPLAYYLTQQYLLKFTERINLHWWHFVFPVAMLVAIMFLTITSVVWKAARTNPVDSLRYE